MATGRVLPPHDGAVQAGHDEAPERREKQCPIVEIDPFITTLNILAKDLPKENLKELKFLCVGLKIEKGILQNILDPFDLFQVLLDRGHITETNTFILQDMLNKAGFHILSKKLQDFHKSESDRHQLKTGGALTEEERLVKFLKDTYQRDFALLKPIPWNEELNLNLEDVYTRLEVKKVERGATKAGQDLKYLHDMFTADKKGQNALRIRIEGPPAMGKSTLCRKIAYDWACGELKQYKLLFFLEMKHVTGFKVIDEIVSQLLPEDFAIIKEELTNIISSQEKSTLFLVDGLDEITKDKIEGCEIANHIVKKLRAYCTIVITTRPRLRDRFLSNCDLYLIVKGFTKKSTNEYIDKYFKDDKDTGATLKQQINVQSEDITKKSITDLLSNPLHVSFLCILLEDYKRNKKENYFPQNLTELYSEVLECTLKRYCAKRGIELNNGEIPKLVIDYRDTLAFDSYKIFSADKTSFLKTDISCEKYLDLGLLVRDLGHSRIKVKELYYFHHKTWLEFFTAFYISSQLNVGDTTGLDMLFSNPQKSSSVLKFLAGISESKASGLLFNRFNQEMLTLKNVLNTPFNYVNGCVEFSSLLGQWFECLHESKHGLECVSHVQRSIQGILLYPRVKTGSRKCDSLCDSPDHEVSKFIRVNRTHCHFSSILHFMKLRPCQIEELRIYQPTMKEMSMLSKTLSDTVSNVMLKTLQTHTSNLRSKNIVSYVDKWSKVIRNVKENVTLQTLNFFFDQQFDDYSGEELKEGLKKLFGEIADNENIQNFALTLERSLTFNTCSSLQLFEEFITKGPRTVEFTMAGSKCQLSSLCNFMRNCKQTESVKLKLDHTCCKCNNFDLELNMCLQDMSASIKSLRLYVGSVHLKRDSALFDTLSTNTTLTDLSIGEFTEQTIDKACDMIKLNKFTRALTLYVTSSTLVNVGAIVKSLRENKSLKHLCVRFISWYSESLRYDVLFVHIAKEIANSQCSLKSIKLSLKTIANAKLSNTVSFISQQLGQHHWSYNVLHHCSGCTMHKMSYCMEDDWMS